MPFKSEKQKRLIMAAAHNPEFAKKVGFPQQQAQKFVEHSTGKPVDEEYKAVGDDNKPKFPKLKKMFGK